MPIYKFSGYILPAFRKISIPIDSRYHWEDETGLVSDISVNVTEGIIRLECETNRIASPSEENQIRFRSLGSVRAMTAAVSFVAGLGITPILTTMAKPDGTESPIDFQYPDLKKLVTAFSLEDTHSLIDLCVMIGSDLNLLFVFNDLIDSITDLLHATISCGRAIEGIRLLMVPIDISKGEAWGIMQEKLNIDRGYRAYISEQSQGPRHADRSGVTDLVVQTTLERTWTIVNRYLEFRKHGEKPLTAPEFPLLT